MDLSETKRVYLASNLKYAGTGTATRVYLSIQIDRPYLAVLQTMPPPPSQDYLQVIARREEKRIVRIKVW